MYRFPILTACAIRIMTPLTDHYVLVLSSSYVSNRPFTPGTRHDCLTTIIECDDFRF